MELRIAENPSICLSESFFLPDRMLYHYRLVIFPMQVISRKCNGFHKTGISILFQFPNFVSRYSCTVNAIGILNHRGEMFGFSPQNITLLGGDSMTLSFALTLERASVQFPEITTKQQRRIRNQIYAGQVPVIEDDQSQYPGW
jgi:hypothetical protein